MTLCLDPTTVCEATVEIVHVAECVAPDANLKETWSPEDISCPLACERVDAPGHLVLAYQSETEGPRYGPDVVGESEGIAEGVPLFSCYACMSITS